MSYFYAGCDYPFMPPMGPTPYPGMTPPYGGGYPPLVGLGPIAGPSRHHGRSSSEIEYQRLQKATKRLASQLGGALGHLLYDLTLLDRQLGGQLSNLTESRSAKERMRVLPHLIKAAKLTEHAQKLFGEDLARYFDDDSSSSYGSSSDDSTTTAYSSDSDDGYRRLSKARSAEKLKKYAKKARCAGHSARKHKEHSGEKRGESFMRHSPLPGASDFGASHLASLPPLSPFPGPSNSHHHDWANVPHGFRHGKERKSKHGKTSKHASFHAAPESSTLAAPAPVSPSQSQKDLHLDAEEAVVDHDKAPETEV
ncbi:hypothetical protein AC578_6148 [Pseudocercospora eumusae]|uniref:Uncharacterized protein n=1 Tax=Pseudocercospora eumusae TaxID=321146 RepID=A0A139H9D0_9PEZI|nr:hypothetical protein AC578_6148 [Pseudocercospora eumusae]